MNYTPGLFPQCPTLCLIAGHPVHQEHQQHFHVQQRWKFTSNNFQKIFSTLKQMKDWLDSSIIGITSNHPPRFLYRYHTMENTNGMAFERINFDCPRNYHFSVHVTSKIIFPRVTTTTSPHDFLLNIVYLVSMMKCVTGAFLQSCECAQDKLTERDVKLMISGRSGGSGTSVNERDNN